MPSIREVAALARLPFWLEYDEVVVLDRLAREPGGGVDAVNEWEEVARRYEGRWPSTTPCTPSSRTSPTQDREDR